MIETKQDVVVAPFRAPRSGQRSWRARRAWALVIVALAVAVAVLPARASARPPWQGLPLGEALERLRARGLAIVSTSQLVRPEMVVLEEPAGRDGRRILDQILAPHGLMVVEQGGSLLVVAAPPAAAEAATILGSTVSRRDAEPIAGVEVRLLELGLATRSDESGRFSLAPSDSGAYTLEARQPGFAPARVGIVATGGRALEVRFELLPVPFLEEEIEVRSSRLSLLEDQPAAPLALDRDQIAALPQLGGDVFRALSLLPGITANDLTAGLQVRGGRRDEVLILLDGQELYEAHHLEDFDGARSVVAADNLEELTLTTGNFSARHGDRMGAVLDMTTPAMTERHLRLGLGLLDAQAATGGALADGGGWFVAARAGTIDLASRVFGSEDPSFGDLFGKVETELAASQRFRAHGLLAGDRLRFSEVLEDENKSIETEYTSAYLWAAHEALWGSRSWIETRGSWSRYDRDRRGAEDEEQGTFLVSDRRDYEVYGLDHTWSIQVAPSSVVETGAHVRVYRAGFDYRKAVDRELVFSIDDDSGAVTPPPPGIPRFEDALRGEHLGLFATYRSTPIEPLSFELGLRYDRHALTDDTLLSPRGSLAWRVGESNVLRASWGRFTQSQRPYELQVQDGETRLAPAERSRHAVVGYERVFGGESSPLRALRFEAYRRDVSQPRARCENLLEPINVFPEVEPDRFCIHPEAADSTGLELVLRGAAGRSGSWFASYGYAEVRDRLGVDDVPRAIDQPHTLALQLSHRFGKAWQVSAAWRLHTGWPTTPARLEDGGAGESEGEDEGDEDPGDTEPVVVLGPLYGARLPTYHRLDVRVSRAWRLGSGVLTFYADVQNLYDRSNVAGFDVAIDEDEPLHLEAESWPGFFPSIGVTWEL